MSKGLFIALEGGEGSGKTTQTALLAQELGAYVTREPGGTTLGERLRSLLLNKDSDISDRAELLMMCAARAQHMAEVILPNVNSGRDVVTDRFSGSTLAYQGYARGLDLDEVRAASLIASGGIDPDLTVLVVVDEETAQKRVVARGGTDRIGAAGAEFHRRVAAGFLALAEESPESWVVVDGNGTVNEVHQRVLSAVSEWREANQR